MNNMNIADSRSVAEVVDSAEFQRVFKLPRRDWKKSVEENDLYGRINAAFRLPTGKQSLWHIQAAALADGHDQRGLLAPLGVGMGKTLTSFLLPVVVQNIQRPMLLLPATLVEKTWREFNSARDPHTGEITALQYHWLCHPAFATRARFDQSVITYEKLGRDSAQTILAERRPDMLVCDECHFLRNRTAARTRKVERYMLAFPETVFCAMSGTITKRSLKDYWHLMFWALRERMPLPRIEAEMERWAEALDERKVDVLSRRDPGVLMQLCSPEEREKVAPKRSAPLGRTAQMPVFFSNLDEKLDLARKGYQRRLREAPGVVCSPETSLACSLLIKCQPLDPGPEVATMLEKLRRDWITPNGDKLPTPAAVWRQARELACGFFYFWQPPAPSEWLARRGNWNWNVRQILQPGNTGGNPTLGFVSDGQMYETYKHLNLDSPMQVALAVTKGTIADPNIVHSYQQWFEIRDSFKPNPVARWVSENTLDFCEQWVKDNGPALIWVEHRAFGFKLAERLKTGFCAEGGLDANGTPIEDYYGRTVVASVAANKEGRNLQAWNKNFIVTMLPTGTIAEQLIGRTHRPGQREDTVYVDWLAACSEQYAGFQQILADAKYIETTTGQRQKVLYADRV